MQRSRRSRYSITPSANDCIGRPHQMPDQLEFARLLHRHVGWISPLRMFLCGNRHFQAGVACQPQRPQSRSLFTRSPARCLVFCHCLLTLAQLLFLFLESRFGSVTRLFSVDVQTRLSESAPRKAFLPRGPDVAIDVGCSTSQLRSEPFVPPRIPTFTVASDSYLRWPAFAKMAVARELALRAGLVRLQEKMDREKTKMATVAVERNEIRSPQKSASADRSANETAGS